jgi:hypothetical protein
MTSFSWLETEGKSTLHMYEGEKCVYMIFYDRTIPDEERKGIEDGAEYANEYLKHSGVHTLRIDLEV